MILTVEEKDKGQRLDAFIASASELSRSAAVRLIESGDATVNGAVVDKKYKLNLGDTVEINLPEPVVYEVEAENIPLEVVYEDEDIIVINKPSGMVVHPAPGNYTGTLVNALLYHCRDSLSGIGGVMRPGIVHRIDKDTSGLLVVAKNDFAHAALSEELSYHGIEREYHALVRGGFKVESGTVNAPIARHPIDRKKMAIANDGTGREAITHYEVIRSYGQITYLRLRLETGRTHQIRVHMAYTGHPLLGDPIYGGDRTQFQGRHRALIEGQCLHAGELHFRHPTQNKEMHLYCPMPEEMQKVVRLLFGAEFTEINPK